MSQIITDEEIAAVEKAARSTDVKAADEMTLVLCRELRRARKLAQEALAIHEAALAGGDAKEDPVWRKLDEIRGVQHGPPRR